MRGGGRGEIDRPVRELIEAGGIKVRGKRKAEPLVADDAQAKSLGSRFGEFLNLAIADPATALSAKLQIVLGLLGSAPSGSLDHRLRELAGVRAGGHLALRLALRL